MEFPNRWQNTLTVQYVVYMQYTCISGRMISCTVRIPFVTRSFILIPLHLGRIRQHSTYSYIPVRTGTSRTCQYKIFTSVHISTYQYIPVLNLKIIWFSHTPGSVLRVKYNSVQLLCKGHDMMMMSIFRKCEVQVFLLHAGTYRYALVRTRTDIINKQASFESHSILFPLSVSNAGKSQMHF
jgi:hypothetical protein